MDSQNIMKESLRDKISRHKDLFSIMAVMIIGCVWIHGEVKQQSIRTDRLYEMFCDMQKEMKDSFCAMQKEIKDVYVYTAKEKKN